MIERASDYVEVYERLVRIYRDGSVAHWCHRGAYDVPDPGFWHGGWGDYTPTTRPIKGFVARSLATGHEHDEEAS